MKSLLIAAAFVFSAASAQANTIQIYEYDFTAHVIGSPVLLNPSSAVSALANETTITGTITFSNSLQSTSPFPNSALYGAPLVTIDQIGSLISLFDQSPYLSVVEDGIGGGPDIVSAFPTAWDYISIGQPGSGYTLGFVDPTGTAFSGSDVPAPLDPTNFAIAQFDFFDYIRTGDEFYTTTSAVSFEITSMTWTNAPATVPLPAGALLLVTGLGALAVARRRR